VLAELTIKHLRNISALTLEPSSTINLLLGDNGSGKTSVLEAIHLLALGRSFRTRSLKNVVQFEQQQLQVIAKTAHHQMPVGLQYDIENGLEIRLNNAPLKKLSELATELPLQFIPANCHQFFEQGPKYRRQLLDWGLFHVEPSFNFHWQSYKKVIQQRNSAIRQYKKTEEIQLWDSHLISHGEEINRQRVKRLETLLAEFSHIFPQLCPDYANHDFSLKYRSGWTKGVSLQEAISSAIERDKQLGYTRSGPHAADWSFKVGGYDPSEIFSRGQQKLFFMALCMAQIKTTQQYHAKSILLIDDISSELDVVHQEIILDKLSQLPVQTFISSTDNALAELMKNDALFSMFHVKQGALIPQKNKLTTNLSR
jgi:DNA replication and repair protein RecF